MCGIFGYIGSGDAAKIVTAGLKSLEYRGYDSWGIAVINGLPHEKARIIIRKKAGSIGDIHQEIDLPASEVGIGHTRWATHGAVNDINAHPHFSSDGLFALAQNGIVENYRQLKSSLLKKGYKFETETDTEVIVRLVEDELKKAENLKEAVRRAFLKLDGRNTIILVTKFGQIIACRNGSPLVIGKNPNSKELYFSSDTLSLSPFSSEMIVVENGQMVDFEDGILNISDIKSAKQFEKKFEPIGIQAEKVGKEGYDHFMLKEIMESPYVIEQLIAQDRKAMEEFARVVKNAKNVYTMGSGTIGVAAAQIAFYLRSVAKIKATALIGSDSVEYVPLFKKGDLIISPSQSGETADVLEVLEKAKKKGVKIASIVNMPGSSMTRLSDYKFMMQAGPEICVMSTKAFTSPISWGYLLAKTVEGNYEEAVKNLKDMAVEMDKWLKDEKNHQQIKSLAEILSKAKDIFLLGKYQNFQIIREGMVKLIEGTYKHAHALPSGDLKHYVITLIEKDVPVLVAVSDDMTKLDLISAIQEVKARGAKIFAIASSSHQDFDVLVKVPDCGEPTAIMNVIPLQLLAYYMAVELGNNVDKPRNIAKSVTVK